jgi:hypothetical protein
MALDFEKPSDLYEQGPLLAVKLWVPTSVQSTIEPIETLAEINTAIPHTYIQEGIGTSLGLEPIGMENITSATTHIYKAYRFRIRIALMEAKQAFEVVAIEIPYMLRKQNRIKCTIGRDILHHCTLTYSGPDNTFSLTVKR